jgi:hypothetical protein
VDVAFPSLRLMTLTWIFEATVVIGRQVVVTFIFATAGFKT